MGIFGVIIGGILHGLLIGMCTRNMLKNKSITGVILFIYVILNAFCSIYRWNYQMGQSVTILILLVILNLMEKKGILTFIEKNTRKYIKKIKNRNKSIRGGNK